MLGINFPPSLLPVYRAVFPYVLASDTRVNVRDHAVDDVM